MAKKDQEMEVELDMDVEDNEPRVYELGFHIDPELPSEEVKKVYQGIRSAIAAVAEIVAEAEPENIQLAYTISRTETSGRRDFNSAFFAWIAYETKGEGHTAVTTAASEEKRIIRFIDVRTDREAAKHSQELQAMRAQMPVAEEGPTDAELEAAVDTAAALA
jgi:ribosomal protein S6